MKTSKRLTGKCSIAIPKDVRLYLGWQPGMSVDIETTEDGALLIRRHSKHCRFCGTIERVHRFRDIYVCETCAGRIKEEIA